MVGDSCVQYALALQGQQKIKINKEEKVEEP